MMRDRDAKWYLAIDQGGHASRALVYDGDGRVLAQAFRDVATIHPQPEWVEHDPEEVVASVRAALDDVLALLGADAARLAAAGLATQRSSLVCWDRTTGSAVSPVISWQDRRAHGWLRQFSRHEATIHETTGLFLSAHYGVSKLRWCLDHLSAVRAMAAAGRLAWGPLVSFLLFRLLRERPLLVDPANASRTLLMNLAAMQWDAGLLELFGIDSAALPRIVPSIHAFGTLDIANRSLPLRLATGDQSAALFAFGAPRADAAYVNIGTGAFVQRSTGTRTCYAPRLLNSVVVHDGSRPLYVIEGTQDLVDRAQSLLDTSWEQVAGEIERSAGIRVGPDLSIVSVGEATRSGERAVRLPLVLGDGEGNTSTVVLTIQLDPLMDENCS